MIKKFGKSYGNMWKFKNTLTEDNSALVKHNKKLYDLYNNQPERKFCKICNGTGHRYQFHSHGVLYFCCNQCGHINGMHEDTEEYCRKLYENDDGLFGSQYEDIDTDIYMERMETIYLPKAEFLKETLVSEGGVDVSALKFLDIGAGTGHFVYAMNKLGLDAHGIEVDVHQVRHSQKLLSKDVIQHCPSEKMVDWIRTTKVDVITCIYAFEHITNVTEIFEAIRDNPSIRWIYFSVPMFSFTSMLQCVEPDVYARILHAAHTHIYTEESIAWICEHYGWKPLGEWRFGADAADILRTVEVKLEMQGDQELARVCHERFTGMIDDLQYAMDKKGFCSEIHILVEKKKLEEN